MTTLLIRRDVHCCEVEGGAIFLDLRTNSYLGAPPAALSSLRRRVRGWPTRTPLGKVSDGSMDEGECALDDLIARGLLTPVESEGYVPTVTSKPAATSLGMRHRARGSRRLEIGRAALFARAWLTTSARLKRGQLRLMVHRLARTNAMLQVDCMEQDAARCIEPALAYRRFRPWVYRARDQCLLDSLVLTRFLHLHAVPATLVLGVAPKPFAAHAWVQLGSMVLNDKVEYVQMYTPILAA